MYESVKPDELLPCPFCGGTRIFVQNAGWEANTFMRCPDCKTTFALADGTPRAHANTVAAWNRRARPPQDAKPVAWRTRGMDAAGRWLPWQMINEAQASRWRDDSSFAIGRREIEPLYATPPLAVEALREALQPFASIAEEYPDQEDDEFQVWRDFDVLGATLPLRIFRRARAALKSLGDSDGR